MSKGRFALWSAVAVVVVGGYAALDAADVVPGVLTTQPAIPAPAAFPEIDPPDPAPPAIPAPDPNSPQPDPQHLSALAHQLLSDERIGASVGISVIDGITGDPLVDVNADQPHTPASSVKLLPAIAALDALGGGHVLTTRVMAHDDEVVLVGGGDIRLTEARDEEDHASIAELADATAEALRGQGRTEVRLAVDDTLFTGPQHAPGWGGIDFDYVMPIQPLALDSGRLPEGGYHSDPAMAATEVFGHYLQAAGIAVTGDIRRATAPAEAVEIAAVSSAPLAELVRHTLLTSDNSTAEVLARLVALVDGEEPSFAGAARAVQARLAGMGLDVAGLELPDNNGLLVEVQATPRLLAQVLHRGLRDPRYFAVIDGLPIAALSGTLQHRLDGEAAGVVRAKTGTLTTATSLSGVVLTAEGRPLVFAVLADEVAFGGGAAARAAIDDWVGELAACGCR